MPERPRLSSSLKVVACLLGLGIAGYFTYDHLRDRPSSPGAKETSFTPKPSESGLVASLSVIPAEGTLSGSPLTDRTGIPSSILEILSQPIEALDRTALDAYLRSDQGAPFTGPVLLRLGKELYSAGCYSESLSTFETAWVNVLSRTPEHWAEQKLIAEIGANLGALYARLGRTAELQALLIKMENRPVEGAETLAFTNLRQALEGMTQFPEHAFKCGPLALGKVFTTLNPTSDEPSRIAEIASPRTGFSLAEVVALGAEISFPVKAVQPAQGTIPVPSVVHWRSEHYAAITRVHEGRYLVEDPTFQRSVWMSPEALLRESSGFFIVPVPHVDPSWALASTAQAASTFGKGAPSQSDSDDQGGDEDEGKCEGLPRAGFNNFYAALTLRDMPLFYTPPVGPAVEVELTYFDASNYDNATAQHGHPGKKWILGWIRHIEVPQLNTAGATFRIVRSNGKTEKFQGVTANGALTVAQPGLHTRSRLTPTGGVAGAPLTSISRSLPDGSTETYGYLAANGDAQAFGAIVGGGTQNSKLYLAAVTDPQGNSIRFRYVTGTAKLKTIVDAIGQETTVFYSNSADGLGADDPARRLISAIRDPFGRSVLFRYDAQERLTSLTDAVGLETTFAYAVPTTPDFISSMTTPYGTSSFAKSGTTLTLTDPEGLQEKVSFAFSRQGIALAGVSGTSALTAETPSTPGITVANGQLYFGYLYYGTTLYWDKKTMRMFGDQPDKAHQTRWAQQSSSFSVLTGVPSSRRPALSHREWYHYAAQPNAGTIGTSAQPTLRIRRITDENGNPADEIHRYAYNAQGHPTLTVDPLGRETTLEYAANQIDLTAVRQKNGAAFDTLTTLSGYGHDAPYRPRYVTDAAGQTTELRWNARGQLREVINSLGQRTVRTYDANGYLTQVQNTDPAQPASLVTVVTLAYDSLGRVRRATGPDGYFVDRDYDALNRLTKTTYPDGTFESVVYQALGVASSRDRLGRTTTYAYNGNMQPVTTTDPAGRTLRYEWCSCGALQVLIDAMDRRTRWRYDIMGRQTAKEYADGSADHYEYDSASGRLRAIIDGKNQVKNFAYNVDGTLSKVSYLYETNETPDVSFAYDAVYGRLVQMVDGLGITTYGYHPAAPGTLGASQLASVDGPWVNDTLTYGYDALGRQQTRAVDGVTETAAYDALSRLNSITNVLGTFTYGYDGPTSRLLSATHSGGMKSVYKYFPNVQDRRLERITNLKPDGVTPLSVFDYTYDVHGRITTWKQQQDGAAATAQLWTLGYDNADQLISNVVTQGASTVGTSGWAYDLAANRTSETINSATTSATHNALNELIATTATVPTMTYEWDAEDRLLTINQGVNRSEFMYDGIGRRVRITEKTNGAVTSTHSYLWDGLQIRERRDATGATVQQRYFGQGFQGVAGVPSGINLYSKDHLGSIREVTDSTGVLKERLNYDAWGQILSPPATPVTSFAYTGHLIHRPSALYLPPYRAYSPSNARWLSKDPIGEADGPNVYAYVQNDPINGIDPLGLWQFSIYGGAGPGGYLTFGYNSGQWNVGVRVGGGVGLSANLDTSDSGCQGTGLSGALPVFAAGGGVGIIGADAEVGVNHGNLGVGSTNPYGSISGNFGPFAGTASGGIGINSPMRGFYGGVSKGFDGGTAGLSAFAGVGASYTW